MLEFADVIKCPSSLQSHVVDLAFFDKLSREELAHFSRLGAHGLGVTVTHSVSLLRSGVGRLLGHC